MNFQEAKAERERLLKAKGAVEQIVKARKSDGKFCLVSPQNYRRAKEQFLGTKEVVVSVFLAVPFSGKDLGYVFTDDESQISLVKLV